MTVNSKLKLALIPPVSLLDYTSKTNFQLMLPHLVGNQQYAYTYRMHCKDHSQYVVLDNGVAEGITPVPEELFALADDYEVNEIVIPDALGDATKTKYMSEDFIDMIKVYYKGRILTRPKFMFVLQGQTQEELDKLVQWAARQNLVDVIGLPRILIDYFDENIRHRLVYRYAAYNKKFHLLGTNSMVPSEIGNHYWPVCVRSHDTSAPFNYAFADHLMRAGHNCKRPPMYFERLADEFDEGLTDKNVRKLMRWCGYGL